MDDEDMEEFLETGVEGSDSWWLSENKHMKELRILLADDQERVRYGLRALLRQQPGWKVIGEAENAKDLLALAAVLNPDLILLDWNMPNMTGEEVILSLRRIEKDLFVIVLSGQIEVKSAALEAGANAFFSKANSPGQLVEIIQNVIKIQKRR
jgi:DNA-binding NarL/FixJ family response regulator